MTALYISEFFDNISDFSEEKSETLQKNSEILSKKIGETTSNYRN